MPEFVIEREVPGASRLSEAELREVSLKSLAILQQMGSDIRWIRSFITDDKIYCIYYASDECLIHEHAQKLGVPANRVEAVRRLLDPAKLA
jgi:hypothetical protein